MPKVHKPSALTAANILQHLDGVLLDFEPSEMPKLLTGGLVNYVWRVNGCPQPVVVKFAPPYAAAAPEIRLDPRRIIIEGRILSAFDSDGLLAGIANAIIRPPRLINLDEERAILVMEDIGDNTDFGAWLHQSKGQGSVREIGRMIGQFIGDLHACSFNNQKMASMFNNASIQQVRLDSQYRSIEELCLRAKLPDAATLGRRAVEFGKLLQQPGVCVVMGDLWPRSLLITKQGVRIIDWEFAHYGRPAQDIGHLAAHLWMYSHCAPNDDVANEIQATLQSFLEAYRLALGTAFSSLFGAAGVRESAIHFGSEVLVRTVGAFKNGYLYEGLALDDPKVQEAIEVSAAHLRAPESVDTFAKLRVD